MLYKMFAKNNKSLSKLVAVFLIFVFFITPLAPVFAVNVPDSASAPATVDTPVAPSLDRTMPLTDSMPSDTLPISPTVSQSDSANLRTNSDTKKDVKTNTSENKDSSLIRASALSAASPTQAPSQPSAASPLTQKLPEIDKNTGGLNYNYAIAVPPGRSNLQPELNLSYNSSTSNNNSVFGFGWMLNIPYIQRLNKMGSDKLYDASLPNYFYSSLDGELVKASSSSYIPKIENGRFNKYTFFENKWLVATKDGAQYKFGYDASSQQNDSANPDNVYKWMLQEVRDANGNYISYSYFKDAGQIYPLSIKYTGNGVTDGIFEVTFQKVTRTDNTVSYTTGFAVNSNYLINEIIVKANNDWVKKYVLSYTKSNNSNRSLLSSVTVSGQDSNGNITTLPPTTFSYQSSAVANWAPADAYWNFPNPASDFQVASSRNDLEPYFPDLNADGLPDLVTLIGRFKAPEHRYQYKSDKEFLNTGHGWTPQVYEWKLPDNSSWILPSYLASDYGLGEIYFPDLNADGLPDLVERVSLDGGPPALNFIYINNGNGWTRASASWNLPNIPPEVYSIDSWSGQKYFVDLNADGLSDFVHIIKIDAEPNNSSPYFEFKEFIYINNGSGWTEASSSWNLRPINFWLNSWHTEGSSIVLDLKFSDINGDGLSDVVVSHKGDISNGQQYPKGESSDIYINNGRGWTVADSSWSFPIPLDVYSFNQVIKTQLVDFNNDGLSDLFENIQTQYEYKRVGYINNGNGWNLPYIFLGEGNERWNMVNWSGMQLNISISQFPDLNGDGLEDFVEIKRTGDYGVNKDYEYINAGAKQDLLSKINYPQGGATTIAYKTAAQYTDELGNPANKSPYPIFTVQQITTNDVFGNNISLSYQYTGGRYYYSNPTDKEFAGYSLVSQTDSVGNITKTYYHTANESDSTRGEYNDEYWKIGKAYRVEAMNSSGNLYFKTINRWDSYDLGNGSKFVRLAQTVNYTFDGDATQKDTAESYTYDNTNGNLIQKIQYGEVSGADDGTFLDVGNDKFINDYVYALGANIVALPSQSTTTDQSAIKVKETRYYYDGLALGSLTKGNPTKQEDWKTGATYINSQKTYNTYGLITTSTDPRGNITTYTYDANNLYPATVTNAKNQSESYIYDYASGQVTQKTDINARVFQNNYDGLGRLKEEKQPDITTPSILITKTAYAYIDNTNNVSVQKTDYLDASTPINSFTYFDGLGRKIQEKKQAEAGNFSTKDYIYNSLGQLSKESLPYFSSGASKISPTTDATLYTNYTYDAVGRVAVLTNSVGSTTNTYNDWKLTTTDANGKAKDFYKDAYGNLVQVDEYNAGRTYSAFYNYDYLGNVTKITDALSNIRNFTYDGLGRRLTAQDLHSPTDTTFGAYTYTYDDAGNLIQTIDPKNQTINYTYDNLNRVLTEDYTGAAGIEITYTYDNGIDGVGRLTNVINASLNQTNTYNALGLLKQESKIIGGITYLTAYDYDRQGNQVSITNPDNSQVKNVYNSAGLLDQTQRKESTDAAFINVVNNFDYSPLQQVALQTNANGSITTNTYDSTKLYRLTNKITTVAGGSRAQDLSYTYDAVGNITQLQDNSNTNSKKTVAYTYDDLNRLLSATATNVATGQQTYTQLFTYDAIGNILTKSETIGTNPTIVNTYVYAGNTGSSYANPHAVTNTTNGANITNYTYDNNGNIIQEGAKSYTFDYNNRLIQSSIPSSSVTTTTPLYRYYNGVNVDHFYTRNYGELGAGNATYKYEGITGYLFSSQVSNTVPLYRYYNGTNVDHFYTANYGELGAGNATYKYEGITGYLFSSQVSNTIPLYRYYNGKNVDHFYTANYAELGAGNATYKYEGIVGYLFGSQASLTTPSSTIITYGYDTSGQRIKVASPSATTIYPTKFYNTDGTVKTKHLFASSQDIATIQGTGATAKIYFNASDSLNSSSVMTDSAGAIAETMDYFPFGGIRIDKSAAPAGAAGTTAFSEQRKYIGQEFDQETGLSYLNARYYNATLARFVSEDPVFLAIGDNNQIKQITGRSQQEILADPQALNSYSYANNNPIVKSDPSGKCPWCVPPIIAGGVGAIGGIASQAYSDSLNGGFSNRSIIQNIATYGVAAVNGGIVSAGTTGTAMLAGTASIAVIPAALIVAGTAGVLKTGTELTGNSLLGQKTNYGNLALNVGITMVPAGALRMLPQVPGRLPNLGTEAFYTGVHTARQGAEEFLSGSVQALGQATANFASTAISSNNNSGQNNSTVSVPLSQILPSRSNSLLNLINNKPASSR